MPIFHQPPLAPAAGLTLARLSLTGRLTIHRRYIDGLEFRMAYSNFGLLHRPQTLTYPNGETATIGYDHEGENSLTAGGVALVNHLNYNGRGQITQFDRASVTDTAFSYFGASDGAGGGPGDSNFRLSGMTAGTLLDLDYEYNKIGSITRLTTGGDVQTFTYDDLNRLLTANGSSPLYSHTFSYDKLGNIDTFQDGLLSDYSYDTSQKHAVVSVANEFATTATFDYDNNGNMTVRNTTAGNFTQAFDVENRLTAVTRSGGGTTGFAYDAAGQRTQTTTPGNQISHFPFPQSQVTWEAARLDTFDASAGNWTGQSGSWTWSGSQFYNGSGSGSNANTVSKFNPQTLSADGGTVAASIYATTSYTDRNGYLVFDYQDTNNYKYIGFNSAADQWIFARRSGGVDTTYATIGEAINHNQWYDVKIQLNGGTARLYVDGAYKGWYSYGSFSGGSVGVRVVKGSSYFDNFPVAEAEGEQSSYSLGGQAIALGQSGVVARDNFNDGNANGWTVNSGAWSVSGGAYQQTNTSGTHTSRRPAVQGGSMAFAWTMNFSAVGKAGLYFFTDETGPTYTNGYVTLQSATHLEIWEVVGGVFYNRASVPLAAATGTTYAYKVSYSASSGAITVWRNNVQQATWTDTTPRAGGKYIALRSTTSNVKFDGLRMTASGGNVLYLFTDHLGSTSLLTDSRGNEIPGTRAAYLPFGAFRTTPTAELTDRGFTGHAHDNLPGNDVGLIYMRARFYVPQVGRFASADTIVPDPTNPQSYNRYSYVNNNPINFTDPTGHCAQTDDDCWVLADQLYEQYGWHIDGIWTIDEVRLFLEAGQTVTEWFARNGGGDAIGRMRAVFGGTKFAHSDFIISEVLLGGKHHVRGGTIFLLDSFDLSTIVHELGHVLDNRLGYKILGLSLPIGAALFGGGPADDMADHLGASSCGWNRSQCPGYETPEESSFPSGYASSGPSEDFAESFSLSVLDETRFQNSHPLRAAFLADLAMSLTTTQSEYALSPSPYLARRIVPMPVPMPAP